MTENRIYTTRRMAIVKALANTLRKIDGSGEFQTDLGGNVHPNLKFWDELNEFPAIHITAGAEHRVYQGGGYKDRFLTATVRIYVKQEEAINALEAIMEDVETVIEDNSKLQYKDRLGKAQFTHQITILSLITDEGVLEPYGVGEMALEVRY